MARQWVSRARGEPNGLAQLIAEKLILLAAGAVFVIAPVSIVVSGSGLPGTYGAAVAIALAFVAIPFLALGALSLTSHPWRAGLFALASWSAMAGALVAVSPVVAATSGLILFLAVGTRSSLHRAIALANAGPAEADRSETRATTVCRETRIELTAGGQVVDTFGPRETVFAARRLFVDHVHLTDRIEFQRAFSDVEKRRRHSVTIPLRLNLAGSGETQNFRSVPVEISRDTSGIVIVLKEEKAVQDDSSAAYGGQGHTVVKQRFLATVSHELRTPLNSIIGFSDILRQDVFGPMANDRQREYIELIHSSGAHLLSVVNTILDVSKMDAGTYAIQREPFDLNAAISECASMLRPQAAEKGVCVHFERAPGDPLADGDRRAVKQIVINLLSNAVKFSGSKGEVRVDAQEKLGGFQIRVSDSGIGMSQDELGLIGRPFAQADNSYTRSCEGTGLGLTVVKGLVDLHGGSFDVESAAGSGTTVSVFIPRLADLHDLSALGNSHEPSARMEAGEYEEKEGAPHEEAAREDRGHPHGVRLAG